MPRFCVSAKQDGLYYFNMHHGYEVQVIPLSPDFPPSDDIELEIDDRERVIYRSGQHRFQWTPAMGEVLLLSGESEPANVARDTKRSRKVKDKKAPPKMPQGMPMHEMPGGMMMSGKMPPKGMPPKGMPPKGMPMKGSGKKK